MDGGVERGKIRNWRWECQWDTLSPRCDMGGSDD